MLTYSGTQSFTVIESSVSSYDEYTEIEVNGEIVDIYGNYGYILTNSNINKIYFTYNGVSYQIWSNCLDVASLIEVASGMEFVTEVK